MPLGLEKISKKSSGERQTLKAWVVEIKFPLLQMNLMSSGIEDWN